MGWRKKVGYKYLMGLHSIKLYQTEIKKKKIITTKIFPSGYHGGPHCIRHINVIILQVSILWFMTLLHLKNVRSPRYVTCIRTVVFRRKGTRQFWPFSYYTFINFVENYWPRRFITFFTIHIWRSNFNTTLSIVT